MNSNVVYEDKKLIQILFTFAFNVLKFMKEGINHYFYLPLHSFVQNCAEFGLIDMDDL